MEEKRSIGPKDACPLPVSSRRLGGRHGPVRCRTLSMPMPVACRPVGPVLPSYKPVQVEPSRGTQPTAPNVYIKIALWPKIVGVSSPVCLK